MDPERMKRNLSDAGCPADAAQAIMCMYENGNIDGALQMMRKDRCRLMDELHESGRKVDLLDHLIRSTERESKL